MQGETAEAVEPPRQQPSQVSHHASYTYPGQQQDSNANQTSKTVSNTISSKPENQTDYSTEPPSEKSSSKYKYILIGFVCVVFLGLAIGLVVGILAAGGSDKDDTNSVPSSAGNVYLELVDRAVNGTEGSDFGLSISIDDTGSSLAVAGISSVNVYQQDGNDEWTMLGNTIPSPPNTTTVYGFENNVVLTRSPISVKLSGDGAFLAVGWNTFDNNRGMVQVYLYNRLGTNQWDPQGDSLFGVMEGDYFGASIDLSEDGGILAVGCPGNGGKSRLFRFNAGNWEPYGTQLSTEQIGGLTITSVALSKDGRMFAIGGAAGSDMVVARFFYV